VPLRARTDHFYWQTDGDILQRQHRLVWGVGVVDQFARNLETAFTDMKSSLTAI
jgi:hypothetical protein